MWLVYSRRNQDQKGDVPEERETESITPDMTFLGRSVTSNWSIWV